MAFFDCMARSPLDSRLGFALFLPIGSSSRHTALLEFVEDVVERERVLSRHTGGPAPHPTDVSYLLSGLECVI